MAKRGVIPTKSKLLGLQRELSFAKQGHDLLEQKRQILIVELMRVVGLADEAQRRADEALARAYKALTRAMITMGRDRTKGAGQAVSIKPELTTSSRSIMGVNVPKLILDMHQQPPYFAHGGASLWMDEAVEAFKDAMSRLTELAETKSSALRLAREVNKTLRRVNALEKVYIPDHEQSIHYIQSVLEESERERFAAMKIVKARLVFQRGGDAS